MKTLLCLFAVVVAAGAGPTNLEPTKFQAEQRGKPIVWHDFAGGQPAQFVRKLSEADHDARSREKTAGPCWTVREPGWAPALLGARGNPPDVTFDPGMKDPCDIYLGLRAVNPVMTFDIKLSGDREFTTITAPAATAQRHFDFEFHWRAHVPMAGQKLVVHARGKPVYLQYVKFVPYRQSTVTCLMPRERSTILDLPDRHFAFPGVAELPDGQLVVVCREGDAHVCPRGRIVLTRSRDGGKTWSPREVVFESPSDERDPAILGLADGTLVVSFNTWDSWRDSPALRRKYPAETARMEKDGWGKYSGSWLVVSNDGGRTWSDRRRGPAIFSPHGPVVGPQGALYWIGEGAERNCSVVTIHRTADLGKTWQRYAEVCYGPSWSEAHSGQYWDEPNLLFLPDGRAIATFRVEHLDGHVWQSYSADEGKSWTWPKSLPVWGFPQQLCRLADGRVLMAYGYRREPLGVRASLSRDGGRTYDLAREIVFRHDGRDHDLGYPYTIQLRNGRVFTVYYFHAKGANCSIEGVSYQP
jgi:hypothetical protein